MGVRYQEIADELRRAILKGDYDRSSRPFPSVRQIAAEYDVAPATVNRAIQALVAEGLLIARPKATALVVDPGLRQTSWPLTGRYARARAAQGLVFATTTNGTMTKQTISRKWAKPPKEIARLLNVAANAKVLCRRSRTYVDSKPVEETTMHFPRRIVKDAPALDGSDDIAVVPLIEGTGRTIERTINRLRARLATEAEVEALQLEPPTIVFEHTHGTYTSDGEAVEAVINIKPAAGTLLTFETYEGPLEGNR